MTIRQYDERLERVESNLDARHVAVVVCGSDETPEQAVARAATQGAEFGDVVVVIKRFYQTVAELTALEQRATPDA